MKQIVSGESGRVASRCFCSRWEKHMIELEANGLQYMIILGRFNLGWGFPFALSHSGCCINNWVNVSSPSTGGAGL